MNLSSTTKVVAASVLAASLAWVASQAVTRLTGGDTSERIAVLEAGQKEILKQLQELRTVPAASAAGTVAAPPVPQAPDTPISLEGAVMRGSDTAKIVLLEFSDFQCPYCARHVRDTFPRILSDYVETGKLRYAFRHYPIEQLHPDAIRAAESAECAAQQGKFWDVHDDLFANPRALSSADLARYARAAGLDMMSYQRCLAGAAGAKVRKDLEDGLRAGVNGTPAFFLGSIDENGRLKAVKRLSGALPYQVFKAAFDQLLATSGN